MSRTFALPGPFDNSRVVEMQGPFMPAEKLFPAATLAEIRATNAAKNPNLFQEDGDLLVMSFHSIVVRTPTLTILVDTCIGNHKPRPRNPHWHDRDGTFLEDLAEAGVVPEEVDIVMCTHLHADHVGWNTRLSNGRWVPTFPNARYLFAQKEVDHWLAVLAAEPSDSVNHGSWADSVAPIIEAGQSVLVEQDHEVADGIVLTPAPGHTPGNFIVRLDEREERAYLTGDVIHHPMQIEHPDWSSCFCADPATSARTRRETLARAADEDAWLLPAHFPSPTAAKVRRSAHGFEMV